MPRRLTATMLAALAGTALPCVVACGARTTDAGPRDGAPSSSLDATVDASAGGDGSGPSDGGLPADATMFPSLDAAPDAASLFSCAPASSFFDGGCGDPQTDPHNCGGCGVDCDGGACDAGSCVALPDGVLATGQLEPIAIAADGANVYWVSRGGADNFGKQGSKVFGAQVLSCAVAGCGNRPTVLVTYPPADTITGIVGGVPVAPAALAVDSTNVYWTDPSSVRACAIGGCNCAPTTLAGGLSQPPGVAAMGGRVFWSEWAHGTPYTGTVSTCPVTGCGDAAVVLASEQGGPLALTSDGDQVYWGDTYDDGGPLWECSAGGCDGGVKLLSNANGNPYGIASDATNLYWTNAGAGTVVQCAKADCQGMRVVLASGRDRPSGIATDGLNVYWRDGPGQVYKCAVGGCGGTPVLVANASMSEFNFDAAVAVGATRVFWTQQGAVPNDDWIVSAPK